MEVVPKEVAFAAAKLDAFNRNRYRIETTGATSLPTVILKTVAYNGGTIIDINPEVTWFSDYAMISGGYHLKGPSGVFLPKLMELVE